MPPLRYTLYATILLLFLFGCGDDDAPKVTAGDLENIPYNPEVYELNLPILFPTPTIPADNPLTVAGVKLGRHLFYDPILSADSTMSCGSCHEPSKNFTDNLAVSVGIDGIAGTRSSMSLINVAYQTNGLFWDGRIQTLEEQAELPVEDPVELHHQWPNVLADLRVHDTYPEMFREAFGISDRSEITKELAAKALAQFERILISSNTKYDRIVRGETFPSDDEDLALDLFDELDGIDPGCVHCHQPPLFTNNQYMNNGLDSVFTDLGRGGFTGNPINMGEFKVPTLRNFMHSPPWMHDGRINNLDSLLMHYVSGGLHSETLHPLVLPLDTMLTDPQHLIRLKLFLNMMEDTTFMNNPEYQNPFE